LETRYFFVLPVLLVLLPISVYVVARRELRGHIAALTGAAFGAVVSPWSMGLYGCYFLSPWCLVPGMAGLALMLIHGPPGFKLAVWVGLIPPGVVSGMRSRLVIESINGVIWGTTYGALGMVIDRIRNRRLGR